MTDLQLEVEPISQEGEYFHVTETLSSAIRWLRFAALGVLFIAAASSLVAVVTLPRLTSDAATRSSKATTPPS